MCRNRESSEPRDVVEDIAGFPTQRIWCLRKSECHDMAVLGADLNSVDTEHA
jgi:hypothetical protein